MICIEALLWNLGTCRRMLRETTKQRPCKVKSTDAGTGAECPVVVIKVAAMVTQRRGHIIQLIELVN